MVQTRCLTRDIAFTFTFESAIVSGYAISAEECQMQCAANAQCVAFTYVMDQDMGSMIGRRCVGVAAITVAAAQRTAAVQQQYPTAVFTTAYRQCRMHLS